ncbi:hypothetical protein HD806DRAFT_490379 [Xylariaceae sp. AK1471]|nr:hypothetical protein HD806DRAFT_490379 [Xylariaceae sp. AK1471]
MPPERLLEWPAEDRWEPLCKYLGNEISSQPFSGVNAASEREGSGPEAPRAWRRGVWEDI